MMSTPLSLPQRMHGNSIGNETQKSERPSSVGYGSHHIDRVADLCAFEYFLHFIIWADDDRRSMWFELCNECVCWSEIEFLFLFISSTVLFVRCVAECAQLMDSNPALCIPNYKINLINSDVMWWKFLVDDVCVCVRVLLTLQLWWMHNFLLHQLINLWPIQMCIVVSNNCYGFPIF